jgi:Rrf2 family transcriptional regulator, nitric oxide-sensitive transcriptional repressor
MLAQVLLDNFESGRAEAIMRLTLHTDFALRVLIQVGLNGGKLTTIEDIAQTFGISKTHLMKVVNHLSRRGYLDTVRGRNGGIRLMRQPREINIGQVVRDTEQQLDVIGCIKHKHYCPIERVCVLRGVLRDATQAFLAVLDGRTLADLIEPERVLSSLLLNGRSSRHSDSKRPTTSARERPNGISMDGTQSST